MIVVSPDVRVIVSAMALAQERRANRFFF